MKASETHYEWEQTQDLHKYTPPHVAAREARRYRRGRDYFPAQRCPACGEPLVARMTRGGPAFPCKCSPWRP